MNAFESVELAGKDAGLVSIVIPCYGQAHFLPDALNSVLAQTHGAFEVIVVNDGSPDGTDAVVAAYAARDSRVRTFKQKNQGLSGARNAGLALARGGFVVFLDADDTLFPKALASGLEALRANPKAAFAAGRFQFMGHFREPIPNPLEIGRIIGDPYTALLRVNQIAVPAMVLFRRSIFAEVGTFDPTTTPAEDYDLYLRITRRYPICTHDAMVAGYRQYGGGLSANAGRMGRALMRVMERQRPHIAGNAVLERAHRDGVRFWKQFYFPRAARRALSRCVGAGEWQEFFDELPVVLRWGPLATARYARELGGRILRARGLRRRDRREVLA